jgi:hypothetical protein
MKLKPNRLILGIIFLSMLYLLCYNYASEGYYQDNSVINLLTGYSENQILLYGHVTDIYKDGFEIYNVRDKTAYHVKTNLKISLDTGIYILGTLNSNNEVIIIKMMKFKSEDVLDVFFRSLFASIIFLTVFLRYWKFNPKKILIIRRK